MNAHPTSDPPRQRVFGPYSFDEASGELSKHGIRLRLQGQPLKILAMMIRRPGQVVNREEFQKQLWSSSTFVDFEHGLNAAMNRLRQLLGDSADQPRYIETVSGRGYRFIGVIQDPDHGPVLVMPPTAQAVEMGSGSQEEPKVAAPQRRTNWIAWAIGAGAVGILLAGYFAVNRREVNSNQSTVRFSISTPDGYAMEPGSSRQTFALSPDGTKLAFSAMNASGAFEAFIRNLDSLEVRPLPNSVGSYHVFWAPDSRSLFLTVQGSLRRYSLAGNSYQVIGKVPTLMLTGEVMGSNLLISSHNASFVVPLSGGTPKQTNELYPWPQVLPDGKHIVYIAFDAQAGHHHAHVVEPGRPETDRALVETDSRVIYTPSSTRPGMGYLVYVRAGNLLAHPFNPQSLRLEGEPLPVAPRIYSFFPTGAADFSVSNNGMLAYRRYVSRTQLAWFDRHGTLVKKIGPDNVNIEHGQLSPDGKKIAAAIFNVDRGATEIWIIDRETGTSRRSISGPGIVANPVWAPDSQKLVYLAAYEGPPKLFLRGIGESDREEKLPEGLFQVPTDWSKNGRYIVFTSASYAQGQNDLRGQISLIDMADGRKLIPLITTPFHEANPTFSPDGQVLAFTSDESGRTEVYVQAFTSRESPHMSGARHLVSSQGAVAIRWRRDGRELFYLAQDGRIYGVPITLSPKFSSGTPVSLFSVNTEARAAIHNIEGFDVSEDGRQFLVPMITSAEKPEIVVIQNWEVEAEHNRGNPN